MYPMILLNFSHPVTPEQQAQIEALLGQPVAEIRNIPSQMEHATPFAQQVHGMIAQLPINPSDWQSQPILINPPSYNFTALTLLAHLHGLMGYFPPILRLRPIPESVPPRFEVAEIINLQAIRENSRKDRYA